MRITRLLSACVLAIAIGPGAALAATPAAKVVLAVGTVVAESPTDGSIRPLGKDDPVMSGESISTGGASYANLLFADGSYVLLRPGTKFAIEDYRFEGTPPVATGGTASVGGAQSGPSRAFFRLLRGGLRTVSGVIGRANRDEYKMSAVTAVLGIRGTDYIAQICDAVCANDPTMGGALPPGTTAAGGLVVGDISGEIGLTAAGVNQVLSAGQFGVLTRDGLFYRLPKPGFIRGDRFIGSDARSPAACQ